MPPLIARSLAGLLALVSAAAFAQAGPSAMSLAVAADDEVTEIEADRIEGANQEYVQAEGAVRLKRGDKELRADRLSFRLVEETVDAHGNVLLKAPGYELSGPRLVLRAGDHSGFMDYPTYRFESVPGKRKPKPGSNPEAYGPRSVTAGPFSKGQGAAGKATRIQIDGENHYRMEGATYSTCQPGDESWFAKFSELSFDYDRLEGEGYHAKVVFHGVPIFYLPYLNFPLSSGRRSGFLAPTIGGTQASGFEWQVPYYWNIAPNLDATITAHGYAHRGVQLGIDQRYLFPRASGDWHVDYLEDDRKAPDEADRYSYRWRHQHNLGGGLALAADLGRVSDDNYFKDFSTQIVAASQLLVPSVGTLAWYYDGWVATLRGLRYQVLQPDAQQATEAPYELLPQLALNGRVLLADNVEGALNAELTRFTHRAAGLPAASAAAVKHEALRTVVYPKLAFPYVGPGYFVTPRLGLHYTHYAFEQPLDGLGDSYSRTVPIGSLDSGLIFEREAHAFGRKQIQTLEPRLYYLRTPYRDQNAITNHGVNFDSGAYDFNFAQIFSDQVYAGSDRIADANQLTLALSSRLLDQDSGQEYFRVMAGQRYYKGKQRVVLSAAEKPREDWGSDVLAAVSGELLPKTFVESSVLYNGHADKYKRFNVGARYQPSPGQVFNATYRFGRKAEPPYDLDVKNIDLAAQWPLASGWRFVGRYNYSLKDDRQIESLGGVEYYSGCWATRVVAHRFATTSTEFNDAFFIQLELKDFGQFGNNPFEAINRGVPGYSRYFPYDDRAADGAR